MKVNIIAEIGSNWQGDVSLAKKHIKNAKESGATHVKFQMWRAEDIYESTDPDWNQIKKSELNNVFNMCLMSPLDSMYALDSSSMA